MPDLRQRQQERERQQKKNGKSGLGGLVVVLLVMLISAGSDMDLGGDEALGVIAGIVILAAVIAGVIWLSKKGAVTRKERQAEERRSAGRVSAAAIHRPDPREKSFTKPETYCAIHDHSGEDHFARDRARRIAQLDDWLKNGLIDRAEYQVLKERFENDL